MRLDIRFEKRTQEKGIRRLVFRKRAYVFRERPLVCRNGHQVAGTSATNAEKALRHTGRTWISPGRRSLYAI